jgi:hypothetical protein
VAVSTIPSHTAVHISVKFPRGKVLTREGTADTTGTFRWSFKQPTGATTPKNSTARVSVTVEHGAQGPIKKSKKYSIT